MPELPEVETVRRGLEPALLGRRINRLEARRADLRFPLPDRFAERLKGQTVTALHRRAKYIIAGLSGGEELIMHLGMTGRFTIERNGIADRPGDYVYETASDPKHDHVVLHLQGGARIVYNDPRRFGFMLLMAADERPNHPMFRALGAEPLGNALTAAYLAARAQNKKVNLKAFLMDQRIVAGLGNIYVSEALHRAGLAPTRRAKTLCDSKGRPTDRAERLVVAIKRVLEQAIDAGGSTLRDYRHADGSSGAFQDAFTVYDRAGLLCVTADCGGEIKRTVHSGRATFYCPRCQR